MTQMIFCEVASNVCQAPSRDMPDKTKFVNELTRVCAPGGRVLVVTWCHRVLAPSEAALPADEQFLLAGPG